MGKNYQEIKPIGENKFYNKVLADITEALSQPKKVRLTISKLAILEQATSINEPIATIRNLTEASKEFKRRINRATSPNKIDNVILKYLTSLTNLYIFAKKMENEEDAERVRQIFEKYGYDITEYDESIKESNELDNASLTRLIFAYISAKKQMNEKDIESIKKELEERGYDIAKYDGLIESSTETTSTEILNEIFNGLKNSIGINKGCWKNDGCFIPTMIHQTILLDVYTHFGLIEKGYSIPTITDMCQIWNDILVEDDEQKYDHELPMFFPSDLLELEPAEPTSIGDTEANRKFDLSPKLNVGAKEAPSLEDILAKILILCGMYQLYQAPDPTLISGRNINVLALLMTSPLDEKVEDIYEDIIINILNSFPEYRNQEPSLIPTTDLDKNLTEYQSISSIMRELMKQNMELYKQKNKPNRTRILETNPASDCN